MTLSAGNEVIGSFDVAIIGSGYGGGVMALRLASAGLRVAVLERGKEYTAATYPSTAIGLVEETQSTIAGIHLGCKQALVDLHVGRDLTVLVGCGLGGTSLINSNVSIEPATRVFAELGWPAALRDRAVLEPFYARARDVLRPAPIAESQWPRKTRQLAQCSSDLGYPFIPAAINVNYDTNNPYDQKQCANCGNCVTGCRFDAKNTVHATYLALARAAGATIFTQCPVSYIEHIAEAPGWRVHYTSLDGDDTASAPRSFDVAHVVLAAGALGSPEILLRSVQHGLAVSPALGTRFSSNGDSLAIGYSLPERVDTVGWTTDQTAPVIGPSITGIVDLRADAGAIEESIIVEDGAFPGAMAAIMRELLEIGTIGNDEEPKHEGIKAWFWKRVREARDLVGIDVKDGALDHSQIYLGIGHDGAGGRVVLEDDRAHITWPDIGQQRVFARADEVMLALANHSGGGLVRNPAESKLKSYVTVHPLGGCPMSDDIATGVVDDRGRVWNPETGAPFTGLHVVDGSIVPSSVGVNPLLTITALAERIAQLWIDELRASVDSDGRAAQGATGR